MISFDCLQNLNLKKGDRAVCIAGSPTSVKVILTATKDIPNSVDVINNPFNYFTTDTGLLTSHLISANWHKLAARS